MVSDSRIFSFENGGHPEVFCGSADWMPRNLVERSEAVFPVDDPALAARLRNEILAAYLADNTKARQLEPDGTYRRVERAEGDVPRRSQQDFIHLAAPKPVKAVKEKFPSVELAASPFEKKKEG